MPADRGHKALLTGAAFSSCPSETALVVVVGLFATDAATDTDTLMLQESCVVSDDTT